MSDTTQTNAMAEIALALAMGFFSIMVLTMVSMGSGMVAQTTASVVDEDPIAIAKSAPNEDSAKGSSHQAVKPENLAIYYNGQFLDHTLTPLSVADISSWEKIVLAVSPDLSMSQTMSARKQIEGRELTVVMLNDKWLNALKEAGK